MQYGRTDGLYMETEERVREPESELEAVNAVLGAQVAHLRVLREQVAMLLDAYASAV